MSFFALPGATVYLNARDDSRQDAEIADFRHYIRTAVSSRRCLEIGPSFGPTLPKAYGIDVVVVDHLSTDDLRAKYAAMGVDTSGIETVDYVWQGGKLSELVPGRFDAVMASHVIEHMTDLVGFLLDCERLLEPDGRLILIVPDKRYCFDYFQPITDTAKIIGDHLRGAQRHSFEAFYRNSMNVLVDYQGTQTIHWAPTAHISGLKFMEGDPESAFGKSRANATAAEYVDSHEYYFTPSTFMAIFFELSYLGLTNFAFETLTRSRRCEFLAILRKRPPTDRPPLNDFLTHKRMLMLNHLREQAEMIDLSEVSQKHPVK